MSNTKLNKDAITYEIFKNLKADPNLSQRALARTLGISLGKANYCLNALINKAAYAYILTPSGFETKARVTARFLRHKIAEYEKLQTEIETLRQEVENIS